MNNFCDKCGKKLEQNDEFCQFCGAKAGQAENRKIKNLFKKIPAIILFLTVICFWTEQIYLNTDIFDSEFDYDYDYEYSDCNVSSIKLHGELMSYIPCDALSESGIALIDAVSSEDIVNAIEDADNDEYIKAIVLEVDSYGGGTVAAEEVANALKRANKPTVALIREAGNSAAYWSATGADIIFASENSAVGSIGVTMSYLDYAKENQKDGLTYNQLSSGKFKDAGNYDKPLTSEEKELFMRDINILHENFIKDVADNRNLDIEKVKKLADGSDMLGQMALENGLIDRIGGINEVKKYLKEKIGEEVEVCE